MIKKIQFSQGLCVCSWVMLAVTVMMEFALQWTDRGSMSNIVIALISFVTVFINGGYITQNICRDRSLNNNGLRIPEGGGKHYLSRTALNVEKGENEV